MISLIIESYFTLLLSIGMAAISAFIFGLYFIMRQMKSSSHSSADDVVRMDEEKFMDLSAIAGDDLMLTQLDLARAYIETDKKTLAKQILESVIAEGSAALQKEAQHLLSTL